MIIAYVDDNETDRNQASSVFLKCFEEAKIPVKRFDFFESGEAFLKEWVNGSYDFVILDIFMGNLSGVDVANKIREHNKDTRIAFCSTSNEFANESYDVNACYYIQKPVTEKSVFQMINRLNIEDFELRRFIELPDGQKLILRNIVYAEYRNHRIEVHTKKGEDMKIWLSFSAFLELLSPYNFFLQCNSGSIINLWEVSEIKNDAFIMSDSSRISISRRKKNEVHTQYQDFLVGAIREEL